MTDREEREQAWSAKTAETMANYEAAIQREQDRLESLQREMRQIARAIHKTIRNLQRMREGRADLEESLANLAAELFKETETW